MGWNIINKSYPRILRAALMQTDEGLLYTVPTRNGARMTGLCLRRFELHNRTAGNANVGIGFRLANQYWLAGTDDGTTFTDDTADVQDVGANDFTIGADASNTAYFVILSRVPFAWAAIEIGTAEVNAGGVAVPDHAVSYSDFAGTGWTTLGTGAAYVDGLSTTNAVITTGTKNFVWTPPNDWGRVVALDGLRAGYYALRWTTADAEAGDTAAIGTVAEIGTMIAVDTLATNGVYANDQSTFSLAEADSVVAFFSVADAGNRVLAEVTTL